MHLKRIYLRYFPPGLRLEYTLSNGQVQYKLIDLLHVSAESSLQHVATQLGERERLLTSRVQPKVKELLHRLVDRQLLDADARDPMHLHSVLRPHQLPIANMASSKNARIIATCGYDKTIKLARPFESKKRIETERSASLTGHEGAVYSIAFNKPHASLLLSGSFDKTCRIWDVDSHSCKGVYQGHDGEVVGVVFAPSGERFGSCSMDSTSILWDVHTEKPLYVLEGHTAEVSCLAFDTSAKMVATGACDSSVQLWDTRYGACFRSLN